MRLIVGLMTVLAVFGQNAFAADGGRFYFNKDHATDSALAENQSRYQIEYEIFHREKIEDPWQKSGEGRLCYSSQAVENCYQWVGGLLMQLVLPSDPSGSPMWHTWAFGVGFSDPDASFKTVVSMTQDHKRSKGKDDPWVVTYPGVTSGSTELALGTWAEVEFAGSKDSFTKVKARLVPSK